MKVINTNVTEATANKLPNDKISFLSLMWNASYTTQNECIKHLNSVEIVVWKIKLTPPTVFLPLSQMKDKNNTIL